MLVDLKIITTSGPNKAQVFGKWCCEYDQIYPIKGNIDSWNEGTSYFISSYFYSEIEAKKMFLETASIGTVADIFKQIKKFRADRVYVPYVMYDNELLAINVQVQSLKLRQVSTLDSCGNGRIVDFQIDERIAPGAKFLSTDFSYQDLVFRANQDGVVMPSNLTVVFIPFWQFSYSLNGEDCYAYLQDDVNAKVLFQSKLPQDAKLLTPKSIKGLGTNLYRLVMILLGIIMVSDLFFNNESIFNKLFKDAVILAVFHFIFMALKPHLDRIFSSGKSRLEKHIIALNNMKEQDALTFFGVKISAKSR